MVFKKQSDFLDELPINSPESQGGAPRRSFNLEDLQNLDPHCRETVSIDLSAGGFEPTATFEDFDPVITTTSDMRGQTLIQTQEFGRPQTLIRDNFKIRKRAGFIGILTVGVIGGFVIAVSVMLSRGNQQPGLESASAPLPPKTDVAAQVDSQADMFTVPQNEMQQQISVQESIVVPESGIVEYANSQPVQIAPRQFLFASDTQRTFGATLTAPRYSPGEVKTKPAVTARSLSKKGSEGRYQNRDDGTEWQGDWKLNSPAENISRAESYGNYAQSQGSGSLDSMRVIQQPKNGLLKGVQGTALSPRLSK